MSIGCQRCGSARLISVSAKCSDMCSVTMSNKREHYGYVPPDIGVGGGDYIDMEYCLECGQIQGEFPIVIKDEDE